MKRSAIVLAVFFATVFAMPAFPSDNAVSDGARKVGGGLEAVGKSAGEIGTKAAKAAEGAARDTASALEKAWDDVVKGVKKAFK